MKKTIKFYTPKEIQLIKKAIAEKMSIMEIGKTYEVEFKRNALAIAAKAYSLTKGTIKPITKAPITTSPLTMEGISIPQGLVWEGNGDIKLYKDHFRIYFK